MKRIIELSVVMILMLAVMLCRAAMANEMKTCDAHETETLYTIGYAHLDTQWRWTFQDSIYMYVANTMRDNFALFEKYPGYHFNFTGSKRYLMMKEYYPEDYETLKKYIDAGRWYVSGASVDENDANVPSTESLIRNVMYGNLYFKQEFGKISEDYMLPDCFGFPAFMPTVLAHAGIKGFSTQKLSWGSSIGIPFNVGVWEGLDGNSIMAALNPGAYVGKLGSDLSYDESWLKRTQKMGELTGFKADFKYFGTGDVGGAPDENSVKWLQTSLESDGPLCIDPAQSDDIFQDARPDEIAKMKRYKGDMLLIEHSAGSLTSQAYVKRWNRKSELLADSAERASLMADWLGAIDYPVQALRDVWYQVLGTQMHDILPGTSIPKAYEFSWNDAVIALNTSAGIIESAAGAAAAQLDTNVKGTPVIVYNTLSTELEDIATAKVKFTGGAPAAVRVFAPSGEEVPAQVISRDGDEIEIVFLANVPSVGYAVYDVREAGAPGSFDSGLKVTEDSLENNMFKVTINENGDVSSVYDKVNDKEVLASPLRLDFMEDTPRNWPAWNIDWEDWQNPARAVVTGPYKAKIVEEGPARVALEITRVMEGSTFVQTISLAAGVPGSRIGFDMDLDWRTKETNLKQAFPLSVKNKNASYNLEAGVIERDNNRPRKFEVPHHQWFDLTDEDGSYGVTIMEDSKYASDKPDDNTVRLTLVRTPGCNSYCDQATQDLGRHKIKYAMAPHKGDWREGKSHWQALSLNQPLMAFTALKHGGSLGREFSFFSVSSPHVAARAAKKAEESDEIIIRLHELDGQAEEGVKVAFAAPVISAREVNGQEHEIGSAEIVDGALSVDMTPFTIKAFAVKIGEADAKIAKPVSSPVKLDYNFAAATHDKEKSETGFDADNRSYSADMLPDKLTVDGIEFDMEPGGAGVMNVAACKGQEIALPDGDFDKVYFLAASSDGDADGIFKAGDSETPMSIQYWSGYVGQWDNRIWKNDREIFGLKPAYTKRDRIAWYLSHIHNSTGRNIAYNFSYLFKYAIEIPDGAKSVKLPDNDKIKIFAMTAAAGTVDEAKPAQLLYDDFDRPEDSPTFSPAEGEYNDSVFVNIQPPWYSNYDEMRYTTDGGPLTPESPLYKAPVLITDRTLVKAQAFRNDGSPGIVAFAQYEVKDVTPPSVENVNSFELGPMAIVKFSEPITKESAEDLRDYKINPGVDVISAKLDADNMTVTLGLSSVLSREGDYTLEVQGVQDRSKGANILTTPQEFPFKVMGPALDVKIKTKDIEYSLGVPGISRDFSLHGEPRAAKGPFGLAVRLLSEGSCIVINNRPELNPSKEITLAAWIRAKDWDGNRRIIQKGSEDNQYRLTAEDGKLLFDLAGVGMVKGILPAAGEWHHVAATYDGWRMRLFVDGQVVAEKEAAGVMSVTGNHLHIGAKNTNASEGDFFKGDMDKIMVWEHALPPSQVAVLAEK